MDYLILTYEIQNTKHEIRNGQIIDCDKVIKCTKQLDENEMKSGFWSCTYNMTRNIKRFDPMIAKKKGDK